VSSRHVLRIRRPNETEKGVVFTGDVSSLGSSVPIGAGWSGDQFGSERLSTIFDDRAGSML